MSHTEVVPARRREVMAVLPALLLAMLLAMLDNMIVSTAMPRIVGDLHGLTHLSWVVTAYVLGTTVSTPLWGKIGDLYGRKNIFMASIVVFLVGSALSGMSHSMDQLIGFRALQGLGAGGLMVGAMAIIGDLVPPRERGRYQGYMAAMMSVAMVAGPLVGGFITDHLSWRWAFYVNLPLGVVALALLATRLRLPRYRTEHRIDWTGAGLLAAGITALVLITTWGGNQYAWGSWQILGLLAAAVLALALFALVERRAAEPILGLSLFKNGNFTLVSLIGFLLGFAMFGSINFLPLYQQTVQGASATNSGLLLLPMMAGMLVTSVLVGQAITRTGRYKIYPVAGGIVMVLGMYLLSRLGMDSTKLETSAGMIVLGAGMGFLMQTTMLIAQNSVEQRDLGVASSTATFFRSIGGSFGVSLFGAIFNRTLRSDVTAHAGSAVAAKITAGGTGALSTSALARIPAALRHALLHGIAAATSSVFFWAIFIAIAVPVLALLIREVPLRGRATAPEAPAAGAGDSDTPAAGAGAVEFPDAEVVTESALADAAGALAAHIPAPANGRDRDPDGAADRPVTVVAD